MHRELHSADSRYIFTSTYFIATSKTGNNRQSYIATRHKLLFFKHCCRLSL